MKIKKYIQSQWLWSLLLLILIASTLYFFYFKSPPQTSSQRGQKKILSRPAEKVNVAHLRKESYRSHVLSQGVTEPTESSPLSANTSGLITFIHPLFEPGSFIQKGEILCKVDKHNFEVKLVQAKANLARAKLRLEQEKAQAEQALRNWKDIGFKDTPNDLVLRKPQLKEAQLLLELRLAELFTSQRELDHTSIRAPFTGFISERLIGVRSLLNNSTSIGSMFSSQQLKVRFPLSNSQLDALNLQVNTLNKKFSILAEISSLLKQNGPTWAADVTQIEQELDKETKELHLIAKINDPFRLKKEGASLKVNLPVKVKLFGKTIHNAYVIPKSSIVENSFIYILKENSPQPTLQKYTIKPLWETADSVVISENTIHNFSLILQPPSYVKDGDIVELIPVNK